MELNSVPTAGMFTTGNSGVLGLEMSLHHQHQQLPPPAPPPQQSPQNPHQFQQQPPPPPHPQHPMVLYGHQEPDPHHQQAAAKQGYPFVAKHKSQPLTLSDEDEPGLTAEDSADGKRKMSPWQRMKWTDNMVRLLIMVVFYIGDEAVSEGNNASDPNAKKKAGGGVLQKKGKWKSVSRAMMERGFSVSPQQCEDKFNDLNKRYKRVNDILGKGTACRVVENQSLLDTMDHLSPKMKDEVRKLLNSKHLFFREMCAYHNSCAGGSSGGAYQSPEGGGEPSQTKHQPLQERCLHSSDNATVGPNSGRVEADMSKMAKGRSGEEDEYEDDDDDDDDDADDEDDEEVVEGGARGHEHGHDEDEDTDERSSSKKRHKNGMFGSISPLMQQFSAELVNVIQDGAKSPLEKRQWLKNRLIQLEEQKMGYQYQAFELEKQRLRWVKYSIKKEREMEREKLTNERMKLENERMMLLLRQKEFELLDQQQQHSNKRTELSSITAGSG